MTAGFYDNYSNIAISNNLYILLDLWKSYQNPLMLFYDPQRSPNLNFEAHWVKAWCLERNQLISFLTEMVILLLYSKNFIQIF